MQAHWEGSGLTTVRQLHQFLLFLQGSMVQCCPEMSSVLILKQHQEDREKNCLDRFRFLQTFQAHWKGMGPRTVQLLHHFLLFLHG